MENRKIIKAVFIFSSLLVLAAFSFPQRVFGFSMNVTVTIDSLTVPERGIVLAPGTNVTPALGTEMSLNAFTGNCSNYSSLYPRIVVIKNALTNSGAPISGSSADVSGGTSVSSNYFRALNIVNGANLAYKSGASDSSPVTVNNIRYVNFTKEVNNFNFTYTIDGNPTYKLYLEMCATCSTAGNIFCNADCASVATPTTGWTNCALAASSKNTATPPAWTGASCNTVTCSQPTYIFLGAAYNTNSYNMFYIFLNQLIP